MFDVPVVDPVPVYHEDGTLVDFVMAYVPNAENLTWLEAVSAAYMADMIAAQELLASVEANHG